MLSNIECWKVVFFSFFLIFTTHVIDAESRKRRSVDNCQQTGFPWYYDTAFKLCCPCVDCGRTITIHDFYETSCLNFHRHHRPSDGINRLCPSREGSSCRSLEDVIANRSAFPFQIPSKTSKAATTTTTMKATTTTTTTKPTTTTTTTKPTTTTTTTKPTTTHWSKGQIPKIHNRLQTKELEKQRLYKDGVTELPHKSPGGTPFQMKTKELL